MLGVNPYEYVAVTSPILITHSHHLRLCLLPLSIYPISVIQADACTQKAREAHKVN